MKKMRAYPNDRIYSSTMTTTPTVEQAETKIKIIYLRGQGADNMDRPHSDAGGFAKREHAQVTIGGELLKSPSWWMGCKRDQRAAAEQAETATSAAALRRLGWA